MKYRIRTNGNQFIPQYSRWGIFWHSFSVQTGAESMGEWRADTEQEAREYLQQQQANDNLRKWQNIVP